MLPEERTQHPDASTGAWTAQVEALLEDWHHRVYAAQSAHYASADRFRTLNYVVGVPAVIFSSVVGTALFAGLEKDSPRTWLVASTSILAAVLGALQTFLRFAEHRCMRPPPTGTRRSGATSRRSFTFLSKCGAHRGTASTRFAKR